MVREPTLRRWQTVRSEDSSGELQGEPEISTNRIYRWRWSLYRLLVDPSWLHLSSSQWTSSSVLCAEGRNIHHSTEIYIGVTRSAQTDLAVLQEKRVDDYWNFDSNRSLSDSWKGFTKFFLLTEWPPTGYMWSEARLTNIRTTTRTRPCMTKSMNLNW